MHISYAAQLISAREVGQSRLAPAFRAVIFFCQDTGMQGHVLCLVHVDIRRRDYPISAVVGQPLVARIQSIASRHFKQQSIGKSTQHLANRAIHTALVLACLYTRVLFHQIPAAKLFIQTRRVASLPVGANTSTRASNGVPRRDRGIRRPKPYGLRSSPRWINKYTNKLQSELRRNFSSSSPGSSFANASISGFPRRCSTQRRRRSNCQISFRHCTSC